MKPEPLVILLAEDDVGHATLIERNLRRSGVSNEIIHVLDGQAAMDYIHSLGEKANHSLLVLLDVKMPRLDGVEVLRQIKADERISRIPVILLTTTDDPREVVRCYELGCSVYITKPVQYEPFVDAMKRLGLFLAIIKVPNLMD